MHQVIESKQPVVEKDSENVIASIPKSRPVPKDTKREERIQFLKDKIREYGEKCNAAIKRDTGGSGLSHKYVVLKGKNQLANKLRGLVSLFFLRDDFRSMFFDRFERTS